MLRFDRPFEKPVDVPLRSRLGMTPWSPRWRAINCSAGRSVGRHADVMPAEISMAVQPTVGAKVYDESSEV